MNRFSHVAVDRNFPPAVSSRRHSVPPNVTRVFPEHGAMDRGQEVRTDGRSDPTAGGALDLHETPRAVGHLASHANTLEKGRR